jgi:primosomal replication protein N
LNRIELTAEIIERQGLRLTPAGIAVSAMMLSHHGEEVEAGHPRDVVFEVSAIGIGAVAERLDQAALGETYRFSGFLANKTRAVRSLVFHIREFKEFRKESDHASPETIRK